MKNLIAMAFFVLCTVNLAVADDFPPLVAKGLCQVHGMRAFDTYTDVEVFGRIDRVAERHLEVKISCKNLVSNYPFDLNDPDTSVYAPASAEALMNSLLSTQKEVPMEMQIDPPHMVFTLGFIGYVDGKRLGSFSPNTDRTIVARFTGAPESAEFKLGVSILDKFQIAKEPFDQHKAGLVNHTFERRFKLALADGGFAIDIVESGPRFCYGGNNTKICPGGVAIEVSGLMPEGARDFVQAFKFSDPDSQKLIEAFGFGNSFEINLKDPASPEENLTGFTGRTTLGVNYIPDSMIMAAMSGVFKCANGACSYISLPY